MESWRTEPVRMRPRIIRFAATLLLVAISSIAAPAAERYAIFKTMDRGRSWTRSDAGMPGDARVNAFGALGDSLFAGTDSGIFISLDEGQSWLPSTGVTATSNRITSFATVGQIVCAGTEDKGILLSTDRGITWSSSSSFKARKVRCLFGLEARLYAGTDTDGVIISTDGGKSWTSLQQGLPAHAQIFAMSTVKGRLFAGLYSKGLYVWSDQEHRWTKVGTVSPLALVSTDVTLIAGHNPGGIYWSEDAGATWSQGTASSFGQVTQGLMDQSRELAINAPVWELGANNDLVFAGASAGIYYSEDRGRTWVRAQVGLPAESPGVAFLLKESFVLVGTLIKDAKAEGGGGASGSQSIRSETNRTPSAAGAGR
jgi:photosystem II stability/assembly factor-like uncharacterized protein